jgi:hypothetical protein
MGGAHEVGSRPFMPDSTLTKLRCALRGRTAIETSCAVFLLDCGISMHLATKILRRDLRSVPKRANLSRYFFFGTFPAQNVKD